MLRRTAVLFLVVATPCLSHAAPGDTTVAAFSSTTGKAVLGFGHVMSADGRYTVFATNADVTGVTPTWWQVYLYDRRTDRHELISVGTGGEPSDRACDLSGFVPAIPP